MTIPHDIQSMAGVYLAFAGEMAEAVGPVARSYFRTPLDIISKLDESPVTVADRTIEMALRDLIAARFPDHGIIGEEMGPKAGGDLTWVVDPIDGTKSFITGFPLFGTLISLVHRDRPFCGLIDIPATGERWTALPGLTRFNGERSRTSGCEQVSEARFYTTSPDMFRQDEVQQFERL